MNQHEQQQWQPVVQRLIDRVRITLPYGVTEIMTNRDPIKYLNIAKALRGDKDAEVPQNT